MTLTRISTGDAHACGIGSDGQTYCWGGDWYGQLGDGGADTNQSMPVLLDNTIFLLVDNITSVDFGGIAATSFSIDSNTQITAVVSAHAPGTVDVSLLYSGLI